MNILPGDISFSIPSFASLDPEVVKVILIALFVFILALLIGFSRHYFTSSTIKGFRSGFIAGMIVLFAIEAGIFFVAQQFIFGQKANILPQNVRIVLDDSKENINKVLGIEEERGIPTAQSVLSDYQILLPLDAELVEAAVCRPKEEND